MNDTDLLALRVFCAVAQRASFVLAARDLGISPAYVSKRIAELEQRLGVPLFHRTTRRVVISDQGEVAYQRARDVLAAMETFKEQVAGTKDAAPSGSLRISTSLRLGRNHVSHALSLLAQKYPGLEIWLELVDRRVDLLSEGFDVDIRVGDVYEPHLVAHLIARSVRVLCAAPSYLERHGEPRTLAELAQHNCLLYRDREQAFGVWRMNGPNGPESVKVTGNFGSNHSDIVFNWALDGHGVILLANWDVARWLRDGSVKRVLPDYYQPADVWATTTTRLSNSTKLRACIEFLTDQLNEGPFALDTSIR
jgi:LysR family transcriptional activator of dmlA